MKPEKSANRAELGALPSTPPPARDPLAASWAIFLAAFALIGFYGVARTVDCREFSSFSVSEKFRSTDSWLLSTLGLPHGSEKIIAALEPVPTKRPILFVGTEEMKSQMTYFLVSSLAWPREIQQVTAEKDGHIRLGGGLSPGAVFLYGSAPPPAWPGGEKLGRMTFVLLEKGK